MATRSPRCDRSVHAEQQRYWVALLNLQRTWTSEDAALSFVPPRHRRFDTPPGWPEAKVRTYLLNNLELMRESHRRLEGGAPLDWDLLNHGLGSLRLRLHPWEDAARWRAALESRRRRGGRLETLQVAGDGEAANAATRYVRATVERSLYYFAQYVDERLADPAYPDVTPGRWRVVADAGGDLALVRTGAEAPGGAS
jgi:hypothetical protein